MIITVKNKRAELRKDTGTLIRSLGSSGVVCADVDGNAAYVLLVYENGKAELRKSTGTLVRTVVNRGAVHGTLNGDLMTIRLDTGRTQVRKVPSGTLVRTI